MGNAPQGMGKMRLPHDHAGATFPLTLRVDSGETIKVDMQVPSGAAPGQVLEFFVRCSVSEVVDDGEEEPPEPPAPAATAAAGGAKTQDAESPKGQYPPPK